MILEHSGRMVDNTKSIVFTNTSTDNYLRTWDKHTGLVITVTRTDIIVSYCKNENTFDIVIWNKSEWDGKPCIMFTVDSVPFEVQVSPTGVNGVNIYTWVYGRDHITIQYYPNSVIITEK